MPYTHLEIIFILNILLCDVTKRTYFLNVCMQLINKYTPSIRSRLFETCQLPVPKLHFIRDSSLLSTIYVMEKSVLEKAGQEKNVISWCNIKCSCTKIALRYYNITLLWFFLSSMQDFVKRNNIVSEKGGGEHTSPLYDFVQPMYMLYSMLTKVYFV